MRTVRVLISGQVQGVSYRVWAETNAKTLGLSGWIRNRRDGTVEGLFSGAAGKVSDMLERCRQGPPAAVVEEVSVMEEGGPAPAGFAVLPTV